MTKLKAAVFIALCLTVTAFGQNLPLRGGQYNASDYAQWLVRIAPGSPTGSGSQTFQLQTVGGVSMGLPGGRNVQLFATNAPVLIGVGSSQEVATPSTVSGCVFAGAQLGQCNVSFTGLANSHGPGDILQSGSAGLQEAINDLSQMGGGCCVRADQLWSKVYVPTISGATALSLLQAAAFTLSTTNEPNPVVVEDASRSQYSFWYGAPGLTLITTPTALTTASTLTTSTTGGSIATATTPRFCVTAVDQFGGETACSADAAGTATLVDGAGSTNSYTITAAGVPTGTGIVGYRLYVSASGGGTQTETLAAPAQLSCAAAPLSPLPGTCGAGSAIILIALPATTAAGPPQGTSGAATALSAAHTTVVPRQAATLPSMLPFNDTTQPGYFPVTVTSATTLVAGFDVMGEIQYPAGFFNTPGKWKICGGGVVTPSAATVAGTWNLRIGPRENSAGTSGEVAVIPFGFVASNQWTAALSHFDFCTDVTTTTTGTSGVMEGSGTSFCVVVAAGNDGAGTDTCVGAFNAASTAFDLTKQGVVQLSYVQSAASWTLPQLRYFSIVRL